MLYTATTTKAIKLYFAPSSTGPDATVPKDTRVAVLAKTPKGDVLVVALANVPSCGWARDTSGLRRDALLMADIFWQDVGGKEDWNALAATLYDGPPFFGAMLKVSQGTKYPAAAIKWFKKAWPALRAAGGDRYAVSWFRAAYHYLVFSLSGSKQAEYMCDIVDAAGGWGIGDLLPVVDLEPSGQPTPPTAEMVKRCTGDFNERIDKLLGCSTILYGGNLMRSLKITDHMGCKYLWTANYGAELTEEFVQRAGWSLKDTVFWQYCGDGKRKATETKGGAPLPNRAPGLGPEDINVYLQGGDLADLRSKLLWKR